MRNLCIMYETGQGARADRKAAIDWYRKALAAGDQAARDELARLGVN
jgi:TPR repeat protein